MKMKSCGRVLTSMENLKAIEEKELVKKEKVRQREERKQRIEQNKQEKAKKAKERRINVEARKVERSKALAAKRCTVGRKKSEKKGKDVQSSDDKQQFPFSEDEIKRFEIRFDNGYDLTNDERYNLWLKMKCSGNGSSSVASSKDSTKSVQDDVQPQNPLIESHSLSLIHCPSELELCSPTDLFPPFEDLLEDQCTATSLLEPLHYTG